MIRWWRVRICFICALNKTEIYDSVRLLTVSLVSHTKNSVRLHDSVRLLAVSLVSHTKNSVRLHDSVWFSKTFSRLFSIPYQRYINQKIDTPGGFVWKTLFIRLPNIFAVNLIFLFLFGNSSDIYFLHSKLQSLQRKLKVRWCRNILSVKPIFMSYLMDCAQWSAVPSDIAINLLQCFYVYIRTLSCHYNVGNWLYCYHCGKLHAFWWSIDTLEFIRNLYKVGNKDDIGMSKIHWARPTACI